MADDFIIQLIYGTFINRRLLSQLISTAKLYYIAITDIICCYNQLQKISLCRKNYAAQHILLRLLRCCVAKQITHNATAE